MIRNQSSVVRAALIISFLLTALACMAQDGAALIPDSKIDPLEQLFREGISGGARSGVASRRAFKNVARDGLALVEEYPAAPNRFRVLGIVAQCQKRMLAMAATEKNREALFETCEQLMDAPDRYAEERLEADLLLSDRDLSAKDATLEERAQALADLLSRYSGTKAEARSLLMGALIVQKLDSRELEGEILYALDEKFADDHEVIEFRRRFLKISRLDLIFNGKHKRVDGTQLVFPADTMGHMSLMIFWSKDKPGIEEYLEFTKAAVTTAPGRIDVCSFNVDELPDGGASVLKEHQLDWTVIKLPGGRRSQAYRTYAQGDPIAILVNEYGIAVTRPEIVHGRSAAVDGSRISDNRYMAQLQSVFIGDFLVGLDGSDDTTNPTTPPTKQVQACFTPAPFRYRLSREEAFAKYQEATTLCGKLIGAREAKEVWRVRDRKIIALLGMWNLACEPKYLDEAVEEAKVTVAADLPPEAEVVARFCLAKAVLRDGGEQPESVVDKFLDDCGGESAPVTALAAATILSIEAASREMYDRYRDRFLEEHADNPQFYSFASFLRDRHIQYRLLRANHTLRERRARGYIVGHGYPWPTNYLPNIELKNLDGSTLHLPEGTNGKLTYLMFVEPPAGGGTNNWHLVRDSRGRVRQMSGVHTVMNFANDLTKKHANGAIEFVAAFLTDEVAHVKYLVKTNGWECTPAIVPGGLHNPMVRQLGILSADRFPNVFVLRRDGSIAWRGSGLRYKNEFGYPFAVQLALKVHVEVCEMEHGYKALKRGDYEEAVRVFTGPFPEEEPQRYAWRSPRYHAKALAHAGLQKREAALEAMDAAIDAHKLQHFHGYGRRGRIADWRKDAAKVTLDEPCDIMCMLWTEKAAILDDLGRKDEAVSLREQAKPIQEHSPYVYEQFHQKLHDLSFSGK